jgi:S-adenosylmethionine-diacylglycerol 3-amino-3-carboxypropyl transferase
MIRAALRRLALRGYFSGIVFHQSWEDPEMDREALRIVADRDVVLSITSGGCNCLSLLRLNPREVICLDANPAQTYLLDLKLAAIRQLGYDDFFSLFNGPASPRALGLYRSALRDALPDPARQFWDRNAGKLARGVGGLGKLGHYLALMRTGLRLLLGRRLIEDFFQLDTLEEQRAFYAERIAPRVWRAAVVALLESRLLVYLAGMHPSQYSLIAREMGLGRYMRERAEHLLTAVPVRQNYFLAQAMFGRYLDREHVPPYLLESNFATLKRNLDRVTNVTSSLNAFLETRAEGSIDKFSLLDIGDWMEPSVFAATLRNVSRVASEGARLVYRSTVPNLLPPPELDGMLEPEPELARRLLQTDRSGVYGGFFVYRLNPHTPAPH